MFSNNPVSKETLPSVIALSFEPLCSRYRLVSMLRTGVLSFIFLLVYWGADLFALVPFPESLAARVPLIVVVLSAATIIFQFLSHAHRGYALREHDLHYRSGIIFSKLTSQPIVRIQHVELKRDLFDRLAGLVKLQVFSAGGASHTFQIPGLSEEQAAQLRDFILSHHRAALHE